MVKYNRQKNCYGDSVLTQISVLRSYYTNFIIFLVDLQNEKWDRKTLTEDGEQKLRWCASRFRYLRIIWLEIFKLWKL